jgi:hypothetical protein
MCPLAAVYNSIASLPAVSVFLLRNSVNETQTHDKKKD